MRKILKLFQFKQVLIVLLFSLLPNLLLSQQDSIKNWKIGGDATFSLSQITLENWSAGGKSSMAGAFMSHAFANYDKNNSSWANSLSLGYGWSKQKGENNVKTDDRILLTSKYGYKASKNWYYTGLINFKTQMTTGYDNPPENTIIISDFLSPAYLLASLGMDYKPNDNFSIYLSPLTCKMTFVVDDSLSTAGTYGVDAGKIFRAEYGAYLKTIYKKENIVKNLDLYTRLDLFSNLLEKPQNIDIDWEIQLNYRFTKYLTAVAALNMIYDDDIKTTKSNGEQGSAKLQAKQLLGIGISVKF